MKDTDPPLVLRPEGTAGVARAIAERDGRNATRAYGKRVWYCGSMFRRERPQRGRYRQFTQMGVELVGSDHVEDDADVISLAYGYLKDAGQEFTLRLNNLGTKEDRVRYNDSLMQYLKDRYWSLSEISRTRYDNGNGMRIMDSSLPEDQDSMSGAPNLGEFLNMTEQAKFLQLQDLLRECEVEFEVDERLVRGLDYYTSTAFEFDGAREGKTAICAGGRYAGVGGLNGVGFATGLDRIEKKVVEREERDLENGIVVVPVDGDTNSNVSKIARKAVSELRSIGIVTVLRRGRLGKVVGRAVKSGGAAVVVVGEREIGRGILRVKYLEEERDGAEVEVSIGDIAVTLKDHLRQRVRYAGERVGKG